MCSNQRRPFRFNYGALQWGLVWGGGEGVQYLYDCSKRNLTFTLIYFNVCISTSISKMLK